MQIYKKIFLNVRRAFLPASPPAWDPKTAVPKAFPQNWSPLFKICVLLYCWRAGLLLRGIDLGLPKGRISIRHTPHLSELDLGTIDWLTILCGHKESARK